MKKLYFCTNTKMSKNLAQTREYLTDLRARTADLLEQDLIDLAVMPSFTALETAAQVLAGSRITYGGQDVCESGEVEYTGEVSAGMLRELGAGIVMIGHSERRRIFGENNKTLNRKVKMTLKEGMTALLSVSETAADKEAGISAERLRIQLRECLEEVTDTDRVRILYEPAWAIGVSGTSADPAYAGQMHECIRECLREMYKDKADEIPLMYGGSVNSENAPGLLAQLQIDGLGIGRSAWNAAEFDAIMRCACTGRK